MTYWCSWCGRYYDWDGTAESSFSEHYSKNERQAVGITCSKCLDDMDNGGVEVPEHNHDADLGGYLMAHQQGYHEKPIAACPFCKTPELTFPNHPIIPRVDAKFEEQDESPREDPEEGGVLLNDLGV